MTDSITEHPPSAGDGTVGPRYPSRSRVAIVHDWFQGFHGAERVVDVLYRDLFAESGADIFTFHAAHELLPRELDRAIVSESALGRLPGIRQRGHDPGRWRYLLPYMPKYFRSLDLSAYDTVIYSSHACATQARAASGAVSICYCHTPMRYAWMPGTDQGRLPGVRGKLLTAYSSHLRRVDLDASRKVGRYVANSSAVQDRIRRFYGRDSLVIHPPVEVDDFDSRHEKEPGTFLWVHRMVGYKRPLEVMEAFRGLPYRLIMVGIGPLEEAVRRELPANVELRGWTSRDELAELYGRAAAFIHVGEEDFGITMVEALAAGMPVLGLDRGGARDIVRNGVDGLLIPQPSTELIRKGVRDVAARQWDVAGLRKRADAFSRRAFVARFQELLDAEREAVEGRLR